MAEKQEDYPYKEGAPIGFILLVIFGILALILVGGFSLIKWVILPNFIAIINWFVPNFWNMFIGIVAVWIIFKIASIIWYPIYSILGKYSYLILLATAIYLLIQTSGWG